MSRTPAIRVEGLGKMYRIGGPVERYRTFREAVAQGAARLGKRLRGLVGGNGAGVGPKYETIWALKDVSFEIEPGEVVGVIGRNGAGKSTLLKILSRITEPTEGRVEIRGRVGSLLEVGTGFHPELTGRENVYLNGAILGMKRAEVDRKFDEIVAFAGVEKFIDTPVKHYSSGMALRLGFAVAAHLDTHVLLVDEILAVGDAEFQSKCLKTIRSVAGDGRTVILVSHQLSAVSALCETGFLMNNGRLVRMGPMREVLETYLGELGAGQKYNKGGALDIVGPVVITDVELTSPRGDRREVFQSGEDFVVRVFYKYEPRGSTRPDTLEVSLKVTNSFGEEVFSCPARVMNRIFRNVPPSGVLECSIPRLPLPAGQYRLTLWVEVDCSTRKRIEDIAVLKVISGDFFGTGRAVLSKQRGVLVPFDWKCRPQVL